MSKYQVEQTKARKEEVEAHHTSFQQDKQYSYSRASQQGSKILDNVNKVLKNDNNKSDDKDILDLINDSFHDDAGENGGQGQQAQQNSDINQQKGDKDKIDAPSSTKNQNQRNSETQFDQESNLKASQRLVQFFKKAPETVNQQSKDSVNQFFKSLLAQDRKKPEKVEQTQPQKAEVYDQEQIIDEDEFAVEDQQYFMQDENQRNNKKKKQEGQDFGNISEIQEKKNIRENNDESAQDVDLSALLNNNKKKQEDDRSNKNQHEDEQEEHHENKNPNESAEKREGRKRRQSNESQNRSQRGEDNHMRSSSRKGSASPSPQHNLAAIEEKRKRIDEAQRKKRELEDELKAIQSEIAQINVANDEKKKKENKFIKYSEISEDKEAQEHALSLIKKMNLARKEKEQKMHKERDMFNKLLQEDIKESHERQLRIKEKMNNEKKEKIQQKLDQMRIRSEERKVINKQSNVLIKEIKKDLYINDPDERYKQEVELPELEKRKKELAEKRKLYKPIDLEEIREHAKKHDEEIKIRKLQAKTNVLAEYNSLEAESNSYKYPKTSALNKVLEDDKLYKMKDVLEMQKKKEQIERRKEYAKLVKEVHVPKVKPRPNLENLNDNQMYYDGDSQSNYNLGQQQQQAQSHNVIRTPNNGSNQPVFRVKRNTAAAGGAGFSSNSNLSPNNKQQVRVNRLQYNSTKNANVSRSQGRVPGRELPLNSQQDQQNELYNRTEELSNQQGSLYNPNFDDNVENNNMESNRASHIVAGKSSYSSNSAQNKPARQQKSFKPPAIEEPPKPPQKKYQNDYIQELRKQREDQEKKGGKKSKLEDWEKYKYDPSLSNNEKYKFILQSASRLEHNARLKELRSNNNNDLEAQEQANNLYIDSIKAKLALLDNMN